MESPIIPLSGLPLFFPFPFPFPFPFSSSSSSSPSPCLLPAYSLLLLSLFSMVSLTPFHFFFFFFHFFLAQPLYLDSWDQDKEPFLFACELCRAGNYSPPDVCGTNCSIGYCPAGECQPCDPGSCSPKDVRAPPFHTPYAVHPLLFLLPRRVRRCALRVLLGLTRSWRGRKTAQSAVRALRPQTRAAPPAPNAETGQWHQERAPSTVKFALMGTPVPRRTRTAMLASLVSAVRVKGTSPAWAVWTVSRETTKAIAAGGRALPALMDLMQSNRVRSTARPVVQAGFWTPRDPAAARTASGAPVITTARVTEISPPSRVPLTLIALRVRPPRSTATNSLSPI